MCLQRCVTVSSPACILNGSPCFPHDLYIPVWALHMTVYVDVHRMFERNQATHVPGHALKGTLGSVPMFTALRSLRMSNHRPPKPTLLDPLLAVGFGWNWLLPMSRQLPVGLLAPVSPAFGRLRSGVVTTEALQGSPGSSPPCCLNAAPRHPRKIRHVVIITIIQHHHYHRSPLPSKPSGRTS